MDSDLEAAINRIRVRAIYDDWTSPPETILKLMLDDLNADKRTAEWTVSLVAQLGPVTPAVIPALIRALDYEERVARGIRSTLVSFGRPALEQLVQEFRAKKGKYRESLRVALLIHAIGQFGAAASEVVPDLIECLDDPMLHIRVHAAIALWRIDGRAKDRACVIVQAIWVPVPGHWEIIDPAVFALREMGKEAKVVLPVLIGTVISTKEDNEWWLHRRAAIAILETLGRDAVPAIPALEAAQADPDETVSSTARNVLASILQQIHVSDEQSSGDSSDNANGKG